MLVRLDGNFRLRVGTGWFGLVSILIFRIPSHAMPCHTRHSRCAIRYAYTYLPSLCDARRSNPPRLALSTHNRHLGIIYPLAPARIARPQLAHLRLDERVPLGQEDDCCVAAVSPCISDSLWKLFTLEGDCRIRTPHYIATCEGEDES